MGEYLIQSETLDNIANAINAKTGGSSAMTPAEMVTEIESIPSGGGTNIESGIVVKSIDSSCRIKTADIYISGINGVVPYGFSNQYYSSTVVAGGFTFHGKPIILRDYAFSGLADCSGIDCSEITTMYASAFRSARFVGTKNFPKCSILSGTYHFWECGSVTNLSFPILASTPLGAFGRCSALETVVIGSVGNAVTSINNGTFNGTTKTGLTITIYTTGSYVDTVVANTRNGATNATIIIKASEATTYNGTSYAAGDTILTSEVT